MLRVGFAELALGGQVAGIVAGVEAKVWGPPIGTDGAHRVLDEVRALAPGGEAGGPLEQLQGLDNTAEALAAEVGAAGNGGVGAGWEEGGKGHGTVGRQPLAHIDTDADDVAFAGFAGRVLEVDAVAEVASFGPRLHERGGKVEAADDNWGWHGTLESRLLELGSGHTVAGTGQQVLKGAAPHGASSNHLIGGPVAVFGNVEQDGISGSSAVLVLGDVVVFAAPEEDNAVGVLLQAAGLAQVREQRALLSSPFLYIAAELAEGDDGGIELLGQLLEAAADAAHFLLPVAFGVAAHELDVVDQNQA